MKTKLALCLIAGLALNLSLALAGTKAHAAFPETRHFYSEALIHQANLPIESESVTVSSDLQGFSTQAQSQFLNIVSSTALTPEKFEPLTVSFQDQGKNQIKCLGTLIKNGPMLNVDRLPEMYRDRSGLVVLSQCQDQNQVSWGPPVMEYYIVFPLEKDLPFGLPNSGLRYQARNQIDTRKFLVRCTESETNTFGIPRSAFSVYDVGDNYVIGVAVGSSSPDAASTEHAAQIGALDLSSLDWAKRNLQFFDSLNGQFQMMFKKSDCTSFGFSEGLPNVVCRTRVDANDKGIETISFTFTSQMTQQLVRDARGKTALAATINQHATYILAGAGAEPEVYRNQLDFVTTSESESACAMGGSQLQAPRLSSQSPAPPQPPKSELKPGVGGWDI